MRRRRRLLLWIAALGVLLAVALLSRRTPPRLPADADHGFLQAEAHCLTCHTRSSPHPRPADHPLRDDCFSCHRDPQGALHPRSGAATSLPGGWADDPVLAGRQEDDAGGKGPGR